MKLLKEQKEFSIYKKTEQTSKYGDVKVIFVDTKKTLMGNMQPINENRVDKENGIYINNSYLIYAQNSSIELNNILYLDNAYYEIITIERWSKHLALTVRVV